MTGDCHAGICGSRGLQRPRPPDQRLLTVIALALLGVLGRYVPALALSAGVAAILTGLTVWDQDRIRSISGAFARG